MSDFEDIPDLIFSEMCDLDDQGASQPSPSHNPVTASSITPRPPISSSHDVEGNRDNDDSLATLPLRPTISIPLTVLTGWLGSGKTTLLHHLVNHVAGQGKTIAILQNETSSFMGVEKQLKLTDDQNEVFGEMLEIANGCVCCSVRSDFLLAIDTLLSQQRFDYVVLECSGIADVGNLITSLWADKELECGAYLDGVVCLVDSPQVLTYAKSATTTDAQTQSMLDILKNQIVYSDVCIVNKLDQFEFNDSMVSNENAKKTPNIEKLDKVLDYLNTHCCTLQSDIADNSIHQENQSSLAHISTLSSDLSTLLHYIYAINPTVDILYAHHSQVDVDRILSLNKYNTSNCNENIISTITQFTNPEKVVKNTHHSVIEDKPKQKFDVRGVTVWTENISIIPHSTTFTLILFLTVTAVTAVIVLVVMFTIMIQITIWTHMVSPQLF